MPRRLSLVLGVFVALVSGYIGYIIVEGRDASSGSAEARGSTMPAVPNVVYIGPSPFVERGQLTEEELLERGVAILSDWSELRALAAEQPLDAVLIDAGLFAVASEGDIEWLRGEFRDGVVLVGLGVDDDDFASRLGLRTLRSSGEADVPLWPTGYRLAHAVVLGADDEVDRIWGSDWIGRVLEGEEAAEGSVEAPLVASYGSARGELATQQDLDLLFIRVNSFVADAYETRDEFLQHDDTGEK